VTFSPIILAALAFATVVCFWSSLIEATFLTLSRFSLSSAIGDGSESAKKALEIINEKTKLVSVTTLLDTISNVILASSMGLILSEIFGPIGWVYSVVIGSFAIMTLLYLLPKAIGIENSLRMSLRLAPSTHYLLETLSPVALPLTSFARSLSERIVGKPAFEADLADEFEDVVTMLEKAGHIEPDAGRLLRSALASSKNTVADVTTPVEEIVHISSSATVLDALKMMGKMNHPRIPVFDEKRKIYVGAVTFRTISKAVSRDLLNNNLDDYVIQPASVERDEKLTSVMEKFQEAGTTIAFVYEGETVVGILTLTDIIEKILGVKV